MIEGIMIAWFILTALSVVFVVIDIPKTPESVVLKWAFVILVVFTGPLGAFFYVLGCREPLKGTHEQYVSTTWRQVLGSTMHCAAGDGIGIIVGAAVAAYLGLSAWGDFALEYLLGFSFGWAYFQAFAMRDMVGGSYTRSLKETFIPELVSMNLLMTGMIPTMKFMMNGIEGAGDPFQMAFWFTMSMALVVGFAFAYPINWWLVVNNMKHGMLTVRPEGYEDVAAKHGAGEHDGAGEHGGSEKSSGHGEHAVEQSKGGHDEHAVEQSEGGHGEHGGGDRPAAGVIMVVVLITFSFLVSGLWFSGEFFG